jgi:hypothetical protein
MLDLQPNQLSPQQAKSTSVVALKFSSNALRQTGSNRAHRLGSLYSIQVARPITSEGKSGNRTVFRPRVAQMARKIRTLLPHECASNHDTPIHGFVIAAIGKTRT